MSIDELKKKNKELEKKLKSCREHNEILVRALKNVTKSTTDIRIELDHSWEMLRSIDERVRLKTRRKR